MTAPEDRVLVLKDLLVEQIGRLQAERDGRQLVDMRTRLFAIVRKCVVENDVEGLSAVCTGSLAVHKMLKAVAHPQSLIPALADAPFRPREDARVHAARALAALGLVLVAGTEQATQHLGVFRRWIAHSGLELPGAPVTQIPAEVNTRHVAVLRHLADTGELDLLSLVWLIALDSGAGTGLALPVRHGPRTEVLLDLGSDGQRATLRLAMVPKLPAGVVPDPARMALSSADGRFQAALDAAWQTAGGYTKGAVLWSLADPAGPVVRVVHESLSLAFAVLFDEQRRLSRSLLGPLTLRRLQSGIVIVGRVDPERPDAASSVSGYDTKLAKAGKKMRVILPKDDYDEASENSRVKLVPVATWRDAASEGRKIDWRRLVSVAAVVLLLVAAGTFALYLVSESDREADRKRATASDLAAHAVSLRRTDPTLAAKLGLAAHRIDPGARGVDAMRDVLADNRNVLRTWQADAARVDALAVSQASDRAVTSGSEPVSRVWELSTGKLKGEIPRKSYQLVMAGSQQLVAAITSTSLALFDVGGEPPSVLGDLPDASCTKSDTVVTLQFSHADSSLVAVWKDGAISTYDVVTRQETTCLTAADTMTPLDFAMNLPQEKVVAAAIVDTESTDRVDDEVVMVLSDNSVISVRTGTRDARIEVPKEKITGNAALVAATGTWISVATPGGAVVWRRSDQAQVANPAGGFGFQPRVLAESHGRLLFAGETGTAAIPVDQTDYVLAEGLQQLNGGAATVAAMSERIIAAGGPGGRVSVVGDSSGELSLAQHVAVTSTAFLPDGRLVGAETPFSGGSASNTTWSNAVVLVDPKEPPPKADSEASQPQRWLLTEAGDRFYANDVAVTPGFVAAAGQVDTHSGGTVLVWDWDKRTLPRQLRLPASDADTTGPEQRLIARVAFTPDGKLLVARHISGEVGVWSTANWELLGSFHLAPGTTDMEILSAHGLFLEGAPGDRNLVEVDLTTREVLRREPAAAVDRISANVDGSRLLTLTGDGVVQLLGPDLAPVGDPWRLAISGDAPVAFAMDGAGKRVAASQGDRVSVYDVDTRTLAMPPMRADGSLVVRLTWSPDDDLLTVAAMPPVRGSKQADALRVWRIGGLDWTSQVCRWAGGGLDRDEWSRYVGDAEPYIDLCSEDPQ